MDDETKDRIMVLIANGEVPHPKEDSEVFQRKEGYRVATKDEKIDHVTYSNVQVAYRLANEGRPTTSFSNAGVGVSGSSPASSRELRRESENQTPDGKTGRTVYEIVCPSCYAKAEASSWHGWNTTVECSNCGQYVEV